jgi:hypothetical protein
LSFILVVFGHHIDGVLGDLNHQFLLTDARLATQA